MKPSKIRVIVPLVIIVVIAIAFGMNSSIGTLSAIGWGDISLLCPLGALGTMLASKSILPRAVISLVAIAVFILVFGRAFCGWICPVPLVSKLRNAFSKKETPVEEGETKASAKADPKADSALLTAEADAADGVAAQAAPIAELSAQEKKLLKKSCKAGSACATCGDVRAKVDSRHFVLGGALLSTFIFGFPVFCLICPIGLTFATIFLVMLLFSGGDMTWSVLVIPALLLIEVVFFRKWCSRICPLSAFMSLVGKGNRTFQPTIKQDVCLETTRGAHCGKCASACQQGIDLRHPEESASLSECIRCNACVEACPMGAVHMPLLAKKNTAIPTGGDSEAQ